MQGIKIQNEIGKIVQVKWYDIKVIGVDALELVRRIV